MIDPKEIQSRYQSVLERVSAAAAGSPTSVTLIAVSKTHSADAIEALYRLGHRDFGENYVQELVEKAEELEKRGCKDIRWHFIGHLQTNKVKSLVPHVYCIHSVDSEKLAVELSKRAQSAGRPTPLPIFIEVNITGEASKSGVNPNDVVKLAKTIGAMPGLNVLGLMCIPDPSLPPQELQAVFSGLCKLEAQCRPITKGQLSMGMSHDYELAIRQGATHVRVGTAMFGKRCSAPFG